MTILFHLGGLAFVYSHKFGWNHFFHFGSVSRLSRIDCHNASWESQDQPEPRILPIWTPLEATIVDQKSCPMMIFHFSQDPRMPPHSPFHGALPTPAKPLEKVGLLVPPSLGPSFEAPGLWFLWCPSFVEALRINDGWTFYKVPFPLI